jgi:RimJ/RimL family protein N-acetyltransferase
MSFIRLSLDLTTVPAKHFVQLSLDPTFTLFTLSQVEDSEATRRSIYELVREGVLDDPGHQSGDFETFSVFVERIYPRCYWQQRETTFLAAHEGKWIGLSTLTINGIEAHSGLTVVTKAYRGRGIATALKRQALSACLERGVQRVTTQVARLNGAMLAINKKLGFVVD